MRIESVKAYAFGPFVDETLHLGPGLTVVHGPNESGKSNWHAALYAGLCGMRRRRGAGTKEDREFRDKHKPWVGEAWEVSVTVQLSDDRRVEIHQDLDGRVDCWAHDADLGRDYSTEIIYGGAPDGSRWLGLNRRSFLSTACVRQADIQSVIGQAGALQDELQRAAATAGTDSTASAALERLDDFWRTNVGQDRSNSTRPLRTAKNRRGQAQQELLRANEAHANYLAQLEEIERLREAKDDAERSLQIVEAAWAVRQADEREKDSQRARRLSNRYPEKPQTRSESGESVGAVNAALALWDERPDTVQLRGQTADQLRMELDRLPWTPTGDTSPHESVASAKDDYSTARSTLDRHRKNRPPDPPSIEAGGLDAVQLREIADELALEDPAIDPQIGERVAKARQKRTASTIHGALVRWYDRPDIEDLHGQPAEELREELDRLPLMPVGDTNPHESVVSAKEEYSVARSTFDRHCEDRPPAPPWIETGGLDAVQLRELARELALEDPAIDPQIEERVAKTKERVDELSQALSELSPQESRHVSPLLRPVFFLIRVILAPFKALLAALRRRADQAAQIEMLEERRRAEAEHHDAEAQLGNAKYRLEEVRGRRKDATARAAQHGLTAEPEELDRLAGQVERAAQASRDLGQWEARQEGYQRDLADAESLLCGALKERGIANLSSPSDALVRYEKECVERDRVAREASRRADMERAFEERQRAEALAKDSERLLCEAHEELRAAAEATDMTGGTDDEVAARLRKWMSTWESNLTPDERRELPDLLKEGDGTQFEEEIRDTENQLATSEYRLEEVRGRRKDAGARAAQHGLTAEPEELARLAGQVERVAQAKRDLQQWEAREEEYKRDLGDAELLLREALKERGVANASSPIDALERYEKECLERDRVAREASRRADMERAFEERQRAEALARDSERLRHEAHEGLRAAAKAVGVTAGTDDEIADQLTDWRRDYQQDLTKIDNALGEWNELQRLLDGGTLQELEQDALQRRRQAEHLAEGVESEGLDSVRFEDDVESQFQRLRQAVLTSRESLAEKDGSVEQYPVPCRVCLKRKRSWTPP